MRARDLWVAYTIGRIIPWILTCYFAGRNVHIVRVEGQVEHTTYQGIVSRVIVRANHLALQTLGLANPLERAEIPVAEIRFEKRRGAWVWRQYA